MSLHGHLNFFRIILRIAARGIRYPPISEPLLAILCNAVFLVINLFSFHRVHPYHRLNVSFQCIQGRYCFVSCTNKKLVPDCQSPCQEKRTVGSNVNNVCATLLVMHLVWRMTNV